MIILADSPVALLVSAWIEIISITPKVTGNGVALLVSARIEKIELVLFGLEISVALLVSAWIEISHHGK